MSRNDELAGQVALVTGASRGIGRAIALELASLGATVIGTATSADGAAAIDALLAGQPSPGRGVVLDVADAGQCDAVLKEIEGKEGPVGILVNNAGITRDNLLLRMKQEEWDAVLNTNLAGVFRLCKGVLRGMMKARRGRIVNVASVVGLIGNPGQANYSAAKAGIIGATKALAIELASRAITVNCVAPGLIDTEMVDDKLPLEEMLKAIPCRRLGRPEEVAAVVSFLMSSDAAYVTRQVIPVNGGLC